MLNISKNLTKRNVNVVENPTKRRVRAKKGNIKFSTACLYNCCNFIMLGKCLNATEKENLDIGRFDVEDIRKLCEYKSLKYSKMTHK